MKRVLALLVLSVCMVAPSFASNIVGHSVKVDGKDSGKAVAVTAKDTAKGAAAIARFLF